MSLKQVSELAEVNSLLILGGFANGGDPHLPQNCETLLLLGPAPSFWEHFTQSPEWLDKAPDPMDRWSSRVISDMAQELGAEALFPFGGPPFLPFFSWALNSGQAWQSPVNLLVHSEAGLMVSYRGALALPYPVELPPAPEKPCESCHKPCLTACQAGALTAEGYDVPACKTFLATGKGRENMILGCNTRRSCPVSQAHARMEAQSAYHMRVFVGEDR